MPACIFATVLSNTYPERQRVMALRSLDNLSAHTSGIRCQLHSCIRAGEISGMLLLFKLLKSASHLRSAFLLPGSAFGKIESRFQQKQLLYFVRFLSRNL